MWVLIVFWISIHSTSSFGYRNKLLAWKRGQQMGIQKLLREQGVGRTGRV